VWVQFLLDEAAGAFDQHFLFFSKGKFHAL
jgi:hypothetical protein